MRWPIASSASRWPSTSSRPTALDSGRTCGPVGSSRTVEIGGGSFALDRSEAMSVATGARVGTVHRPDLAGALVVKSVAAQKDRKRGPERHLADLAFLYSLVVDPAELNETLSAANRRRLRAVTALADDRHEAWRQLADEVVIADAHAAFRVIGAP